MVEKVKQEKVIIITDELLTGDELIEVIHHYKLENMLVEKIDIRTTFDEPRFDRRNGVQISKPNGIEYVYIFVDKAVLKNEI